MVSRAVLFPQSGGHSHRPCKSHWWILGLRSWLPVWERTQRTSPRPPDLLSHLKRIKQISSFKVLWQSVCRLADWKQLQTIAVSVMWLGDWFTWVSIYAINYLFQPVACEGCSLPGQQSVLVWKRGRALFLRTESNCEHSVLFYKIHRRDLLTGPAVITPFSDLLHL